MWNCWESCMNPLESKEIKPVNPKGNQSWIFTGRTDAEAPILWPPDTKSQLIGKDPDAGKDWKQEEKGMTEDEMIGWHHWYNEHELGKTAGDTEGQRSLVCVRPWGWEVSDVIRWVNNNKVWTFSVEAVKLLAYPPEVWYHFLLPPISLHVHKSRCYSSVLININLIPRSGITFLTCLAGGITAPGSLPPEPALSGPCALTSQIKLLNASSAPSTPLQNISSTKLSSLTSLSFMYTSQLPWHH